MLGLVKTSADCGAWLFSKDPGATMSAYQLHIWGLCKIQSTAVRADVKLKHSKLKLSLVSMQSGDTHKHSHMHEHFGHTKGLCNSEDYCFAEVHICLNTSDIHPVH